MKSKPRKLQYFELTKGRYPFREWLLGHKNTKTRHRLEVRLRKLELGNPGYWKSLGDGVIELKEDFGPGYRIYLGEDGPRLVLLLVGGSKASQKKDVKLAKTYWEIHKTR